MAPTACRAIKLKHEKVFNMLHLALLLLWPALAIAAPASASRAIHAPILVPRGSNADLVADKYIVYLRSDASQAHDTRALMDAFNIKPAHEYTSLFRGFSADLDAHTLAGLRKHAAVDFIEQVATASVSSYKRAERGPGNSTGATVEQSRAPWNLNRISSRALTSELGSEYTYDARAGEGTCVYVVDTGVDDTHPEFEGRALQVKSFIVNETGDNSQNGHGTHVAGIIGSASYGVAKKAKIFGIKVLSSSGAGPNDAAIAGEYLPSAAQARVHRIGLDFVSTDAANRSCPNGIIVNYSIASPFTKALNNAAAALVKKGIFVAVAAGNFGIDVAFTSPSSEPTVCTVAAVDVNSLPMAQTSYGPGVDIMAPGMDILSLQPDNRTALMSGTSQAAPHAAGLAAYFASIFGKSSLPTMCQYMKNVAAKGPVQKQKLYTTNLVVTNAIVHK